MAGYIGSKTSVTVISPQTDSRYVNVTGDTMTADGATVLTVDRATSDGTIIDLQKDGSSVGSVGAATASGVTSIYAGNDDTALWFRNGIDAVTPFSISGNTTRDAAINIGQSGGRFKDLYLSGGVYLGGTGAANYLDDYEEGTWTPDVYHTSSNNSTWATKQGFYVKVGRLITAWGRCDSGNSGTSGSALTLSGLPIAADTSTVFAHCAGSYTFNGTSTSADKWQVTNATTFVSYGDNNNLNQVSYIGFFVTYFTS